MVPFVEKMITFPLIALALLLKSIDYIHTELFLGFIELQ